MINEAYDHKMLDLAVKDFHNIDKVNDHQLSFLDIVNYEKGGPQQKQIGQFLEHNFDTLRNLHINGSYYGDVTIEDLKEAALLTSGDSKAIASQQSGRAWASAGESTLVAAQAMVGATAGAALIFGPEAAIAMVAVDVIAVGGSAIAGYYQEAGRQKAMQTQINTLHP